MGSPIAVVAHDVAVARRLSFTLAAVFGAASLIGILVPDLFRDPAGYVGNARGTSLAILTLAIPTLIACARATPSPRVTIIWLGAVAYLIYNAMIFAFAVGFNALFPLYVAALSLSICALVALLVPLDVGALVRDASPRMPVRAIGGYLIAIAALFACVWLADIVPAMLAGTRPEGLRGTSLLTSPVEVMDLGFTLPLAAVGGARLWRRRPSGFLIAGLMLVMLELEGASVAIDQAFGHLADPTQPLATVPLFAGLTLIGLVPMLVFLRHLDTPVPAQS